MEQKKIFLIFFKLVLILFYFLIIIFIVVLYYSFPSNSFCININSQELKSSSNFGIHSIYIENDSISEYYRIVWEKEESAPKIVRLRSIQDGYVIYKGWEDKKLDIKRLILKPNSVYTFIRHEANCAASFKVRIITDEKSNIKNASNICD